MGQDISYGENPYSDSFLWENPTLDLVFWVKIPTGSNFPTGKRLIETVVLGKILNWTVFRGPGGGISIGNGFSTGKIPFGTDFCTWKMIIET